MRQKVLFLAVLLAIMGALIAALFLLNVPAPDEPLPEELRALSKVYELEGAVQSIRIEQSGKTPFTLVAQAPGEGESVSGTLLGRESLPVDTVKAGAVLSASVSLVYTELVHETTDDYARFGLGSPRARVILASDRGEELTLLIGDAAPGGIGVYLRMESSPEIYLVPVYTLDNFLLPELDYLSHTITPQADYPLSFGKLTLGGSVRAETGEIVIVPGDTAGYYDMEVPYSQPLDASSGMGAVQALFGLQSGNIARLYPAQQDLEELGLVDAWATAVVEGGGSGGFALHVSKPDADGQVFIYREDIPIIYTANAEDLPWADADAFSMISKIIFAPRLSEMTEVAVVASGREYAFALTGEGDERSVNLDGSSPDYDDFTRFFETMTAARIQEPSGGAEPESGAVLTFIYRSDDIESTVAFYPSIQPRRYLMQLDDGPVFLTSSLYADRVLESLDRLLSGQPVPTYLG